MRVTFKQLLLPALASIVIASCTTVPPMPDDQPPTAQETQTDSRQEPVSEPFQPVSQPPVTPTPETPAPAQSEPEPPAPVKTEPDPEAEVEPPVFPRTTILSHKGSDQAIDLVPTWITTYLAHGEKALEESADFKGLYCFVSEKNAGTLKEALDWEKSLALNAELTAKTQERYQLEEPVPLTGARKEASWWMEISRPVAQNSFETETCYTLYVLYTVPREQFDRALKR